MLPVHRVKISTKHSRSARCHRLREGDARAGYSEHVDNRIPTVNQQYAGKITSPSIGYCCAACVCQDITACGHVHGPSRITGGGIANSSRRSALRRFVKNALETQWTERPRDIP
jgi:hypothetical protein